LTADLDTRAAVVITNAYARGWSARSVASDEEFEVVAADHALQAVVLSAGKHEMVLEYRARLLPVGAIVSAVGLVVLSLMFFTNWRVILRE
ncbi:MAG TPA: hypothetical protein PK402_10620, partial [Tepidisphaeraceae bacterium]|nr:hypothetical protein [Tepidisphaeraceae bacterium]